VHVCLAITDWHARPCGAQQEKIVSVQHKKIIYVQQRRKQRGYAVWAICSVCEVC
jgi:hypothetical protein